MINTRKMRKLLHLTTCFLSMIMPLSLTSRHFKIALADNEIENIGYLYTIETVSSSTKVIINDDNIFTMLDDIGRAYSYEWINVPIGGNDPPLPPPGQIGNGTGNQINGGYIQIKQYYYYATPTSPKIIGRTMMKNDIDSVYHAIHYLENLATSYGVSDKNNSVLGYIRTIKTSYDTDEWSVVAGSANSSFNDYVNSLSNIGMTIREYFASFINASYYNSAEHGDCSSIYLNKELNLFDPITEESDIDLLHMFASLDAIFLNTGEGYYNFPYNMVTGRTYRYLSDWAGDLQTATVSLTAYTGTISSFEDILQNPNLSFDYYDFYADVDALNIACNIVLSNSINLSSLFINYYQNIANQEARIVQFNTNIIFMDDENASLSFSNLQSIIFEMLCMNSDGTHRNWETIGTCLVKYHLLGYSLGGQYSSMPSLNIRQNIGNLFSMYLWSFVDG